MDEQMDVAWYVPSDVEQLQLFQATSYILEENRIEFLAGPDGNSFEFQVPREFAEMLYTRPRPRR